MRAQKVYAVSDLFFTSWEQLSSKAIAEVYGLYNTPVQSDQEGFRIISILRRLRKNPHLVNKINVAQAVDIFNNLQFIQKPWYFFPELPTALLAVKPMDEMAKTSFDRFIYADNEFTMFLCDPDPKYLRRLAVTLYSQPDEDLFDKESVDWKEKQLIGKVEPWQLDLVFFTFAHIREAVMKRCKTLLPSTKGKDNPDVPEVKPKPVNTGPMWYNIKHQAARTGVFGTFDDTGNANMYSVLDHLEILCREKNNGKP
jgi:hypothetical protein